MSKKRSAFDIERDINLYFKMDLPESLDELVLATAQMLGKEWEAHTGCGRYVSLKHDSIDCSISLIVSDDVLDYQTCVDAYECTHDSLKDALTDMACALDDLVNGASSLRKASASVKRAIKKINGLQ